MRAFLVGVLNTDRMPPVLDRVGIYSESAMTLTSSWNTEIFVDLLIQDDGRDFEEARRNVLLEISRVPWVRSWAIPLLDRETREAYDRLDEEQKYIF